MPCRSAAVYCLFKMAAAEAATRPCCCSSGVHGQQINIRLADTSSRQVAQTLHI